jgi:hypothetical protein
VEETRELTELTDPVTRAQRAGELLPHYQSVVTEMSRIRREAVQELIDRGLSHAEIATKLGVSRGRVGQLTTSGPPPERAFFGTDRLTVAVGGKLEAPKDASGEQGRVVAQEDFDAYLHLSELAKGLKLETTHEVVPLGGMIRLTRDNLVVICGPRLSPLIAQILESDPNLGFERDDQGWYLIDRQTGTIFRSPADSDQPGDIGLLARLPRPDMRGSFVYIAGIHAIGASGVIHYLEHHLAEVYKEVKTRRFSTLVQCEYDDATREVTSSKRVTPLYRPEGS